MFRSRSEVLLSIQVLQDARPFPRGMAPRLDEDGLAKLMLYRSTAGPSGRLEANVSASSTKVVAASSIPSTRCAL